MSENIIDTLHFSDATDLRRALFDVQHNSDLRDITGYRGPIGIETPDGQPVRSFQIVVRTLSDGSKTVDFRIVPWEGVIL